MKKIIYLLTGASMLIGYILIGFSPGRAVAAQTNKTDGGITLYSSPEFFEMASGWAESFYSINNQAQIRVKKLSEQSADSEKMHNSKLLLVSDHNQGEIISASPWKIILGRNPVVPVMSKANPKIESIFNTGLQSKEFPGILSGSKQGEFSALFIQDDPAVIEILRGFANMGSANMEGRRFSNSSELIDLLGSEPGAIAFVKISDILTAEKDGLLEGISIIPMDINANGQIDPFEKTYESSQDFLRGVWLGKYPVKLVQKLYLISDAVPSNDSEISFLSYLFVNGNKLLAESNFSGPVSGEIQSALASLNKTEITGEPLLSGQNGILIIILAGLAVVVFVIPGIILLQKNKPILISKGIQSRGDRVFTFESLNNPKGLMFDKSHTWTFMEKDGNVRLGIDDFMQHLTGPVTRLNLLNPGEKVKKGEKIIVLSNKGKQISIKSPLSGIITEINHALISSPSLVNEDPYSKGWVYVVEPFNWQTEIRGMLMTESYIEWLKQEFTRVKDFLTNLVSKNHEKYGQMILTDGGEIPDNALNILGAEEWEEFQYQFIDKSKKL